MTRRKHKKTLLHIKYQRLIREIKMYLQEIHFEKERRNRRKKKTISTRNLTQNSDLYLNRYKT